MCTTEHIRKSILSRMKSIGAFRNNPIKMEFIIHCGFPHDVLGKVKNEIHNLLKEGLIEYKHQGKKIIFLNIKRLGDIEKEIHKKTT